MMKLRKTDYLQRLSRCARWMLPKAEAEDILEDYREIINQNPRPEQELYQNLGSPSQVVRMVVQPKAYNRWLAVFILSAVCLLLPAASFLPLGIGFWVFNWFSSTYRPLNPLSVLLLGAALALTLVWFWRREGKKRPFPWRMLPVLILLLAGIAVAWWIAWSFLPPSELLLVVGLALTLVWFRRRKGGKEPMPWIILPVLLLLLAGIAGVWWIAWMSLSPAGLTWFLEAAGEGSVRIGRTIGNYLTWGGTAAAVLGMVGLVNARLSNRRWRAVYVLSLTLAVLCVSMIACLHSMSLDFDSEMWMLPYWRKYILLTAVGLVGTGASLC